MSFLLAYLAVLTPSGTLAVYVFPEISLQAKASGGLKAYLPDSCGVEGFGLQVKSKEEGSWRTGNGTKIGRFWSWEDRLRALRPGDKLDYSPRVWYRGSSYTLPIAEWVVPELVDDYTVPPLDELEQECPPQEHSTRKPKLLTEPKGKHPEQEGEEPNKKKKEGRLRPRPKALPPKKEHEDDKGNDEDDDEPPEFNLPKVGSEGGDDDGPPDFILPTAGPHSGPPFSISCNWMDQARPSHTKEEALEKQLAMLQCEMSSFLERTTKLTSELNKELLELKKLNYATVAKMQRLESLIRTIPRAVPFSFK